MQVFWLICVIACSHTTRSTNISYPDILSALKVFKMSSNTWLATLNTIANGGNITTPNKTDDSSTSEAELTALLLCHVFLGTVGFLVNLGVILVLINNKIMLDFPANWFVLSLAAGDATTCVLINLLVSVFIIPGEKVEIVETLLRFVFLSGCGNLLLLTFNRFLSVYNPLRYPAYMTTFKAKRLAVIPWITALLLSASYEYSRWAKVKHASYVGFIYYCALVLSITAFNIYIFKVAREKSKEIKKLETAVLGPKLANKRSSAKEYRLAIRLLVVTVTFLVSCITLIVFAGVNQSNESPLSQSFHVKFAWFALSVQLNTIIDPLVYSINHPVFTRYFHRIRNCLRQRNVLAQGDAFHIGKVKIDCNKNDNGIDFMNHDQATCTSNGLEGSSSGQRINVRCAWKD